MRSQLTQQSGITMQTQNAESLRAYPVFNSSEDQLHLQSNQANFQLNSAQLLNGNASQAMPTVDLEQYASAQASGFKNLQESIQQSLQDGQVGSGLIRRALDGNLSSVPMASRVGVSEQRFNMSGGSGLQSQLNQALQLGSENAQSGLLDQR